VLIFLVVTTTFKQQPSFRIALPESKTAQPGASETAPVIITINKEPPYFYLADRAITLERLEAELKSRASANPKLAVEIRPAKESTVEQFYRALDAVKAANITTMNWQAAPQNQKAPKN
jgi:biopolymer transport protein ExbD